MTSTINQQLIDNISQLLKRSIIADSALMQLREDKKAGFSAIFKADAGFTSQANTFQPYIEEVSNDLLAWQQSQDKNLLVILVKKIDKLFKILTEFEKNYQQASNVVPVNAPISNKTH